MEQELGLYFHKTLSSLDAIRILNLEPGCSADIIKCKLQEHPLAEAGGEYEAISYVWGTHKDTQNAICDGKILRISPNLDSCLRNFRLQQKSRLVWVDAVCINQQDNAEKSHQVRRMGEIFRRARRVLCWLGRDTDGIARDCFSFVRKATKAIEQECQKHQRTTDILYHLKPTGLLATTEDWDKVTHLLDLTWFKRLWVVQESALARECCLFWGPHQIHLYEVLGLAGWLAYSSHAPNLKEGAKIGKLLGDVFHDIMRTFNNRPTWRDKMWVAPILDDLRPLEKQLYTDLLFTARSLQATDPRDVIYSLLGSPLAHYPNGEVMVAPDYNESWACLQTRVAHALLRNPREAPHVLLLVIHESRKELEDKTIPSWVPRWRTFNDNSVRPIPLIWSLEHRQSPYRASLGTGPFNPKFLSDKILCVTGFKFDTLIWTSERLKSGELRTNTDDWDPFQRGKRISIIKKIWTQLLERSLTPPEELLEQFSLALARGRPRSEEHVNNFLAYCEALRATVGTDTMPPFPCHDSSKGNASYAERATERARDRCIALTGEGRLALVPLIAEAGDSCCIIQGMAVPLILRKTRGETYQCVGDSYCSGVMEGELLALGAPYAPQWQSFQVQ